MNKKCPNCGEQIDDAAKKCHRCGAWIHESQPAVNTQEEPRLQTSGLDEDDEESFFNAYFKKPFFKQYTDFGGVTGRKAFWLSTLMYTIVALGVAGMAMLIAGVLPFIGLIPAALIAGIFSLLMFVPSLALQIRRLRDAGLNPLLFLLVFVPIIGSIILLIMYCKPSRYEHSEKAGWKTSDSIMAGICAILFAAGIFLAGSSLGGNDDYDVSEDYDIEEDYDKSEDYAIEEEDYAIEEDYGIEETYPIPVEETAPAVEAIDSTEYEYGYGYEYEY